MDRLTSRIASKVYFTNGKHSPATLCAEMETWDIRECMEKLAKYEDMGLDPDEMSDKVKEILGSLKHIDDRIKRMENESKETKHISIRDLELVLLNIWKSEEIELVYKYKNRIKAFREPLTNIELFYDITMNMFKDVEDVASYSNSSPESFKVKVEDLIQARLKCEQNKEGVEKHG